MIDDDLDSDGDSARWYITQCQAGQKRLCVMDAKQQWSCALQFQDWGICNQPTVRMLPYPCSLWICLMEPERSRIGYYDEQDL